MTNLTCTVKSCRHNKAECCCRPEITVGGHNAEEACETNCCDYKKLSNDSSFPLATNSIGAGYDQPNKSLRVTCEAKNCTYNKDRLCNADKIDVKVGSAGTECATFREN